ncbi:MAG: ABC transporter substrate-binding protein [Thermodesulfobacteriota bacterium]
MLSLLVPWKGQTAEKINFGTAVKMSPEYYLTMPAAQEQGFWKKNGLDAQWVPMRGSGTLYRTVAAREIKVGASPGVSFIQAAGRGIPVLIISTLETSQSFHGWVLKNSRFKRADDLKGKPVRVGIPRIGGALTPMAWPSPR